MADIVLQVWIDAPVERAFSGLATAEGLGAWWAPHATKQTPRGTVLSHEAGEGNPPVEFLVRECVPQERVEWDVISRHPSQSPASAWTGTHIAFEFRVRPNPGGWMGIATESPRLTVLEFRHSGWDEDSPYYGFCAQAWGETLALFRAWCEADT